MFQGAHLKLLQSIVLLYCLFNYLLSSVLIGDLKETIIRLFCKYFLIEKKKKKKDRLKISWAFSRAHIPVSTETKCKSHCHLCNEANACRCSQTRKVRDPFLSLHKGNCSIHTHAHLQDGCSCSTLLPTCFSCLGH